LLIRDLGQRLRIGRPDLAVKVLTTNAGELRLTLCPYAPAPAWNRPSRSELLPAWSTSTGGTRVRSTA
jgi:hypothetical protein